MKNWDTHTVVHECVSERVKKSDGKTLDLTVSSKDTKITKEELNSITNMKNLKKFILVGHHLRELPENFGQLCDLETLDISRNEVFDIKALSGMAKLVELSLKSNQFTSLPKEILKMTSLEKLDISFNDLKSFGFGISLTKPKLPPLKELNIAMNSLSKFPTKILDFKQLQHLDLSRNRFSEIPSDIIKLTELKSLIMEEIELPRFPIDLINIPTIEKLNLSKNKLYTVANIASMLNLKELYLSYCELSSFEVFNSLKSLVILHLTDNAIVELKPNLPNLKELKLARNGITKIDQDIGNCTSLEVLELTQNQISFVDPSIGKLTKLQKLDLSHNKITSIDLCTCTKLIEIELSSNKLTSLFDFSKLSELLRLSVKHNKLGAFPTGLGLCKSLEQIDMTYNFIALIPNEICELTKLSSIRLKHNDIDIIPKNVKNMSGLVDLNLDHNGILEIPDEIVNCPKLKGLFLSYNAPNGLKISDTMKAWIQEKAINLTQEFEFCSKIADGLYLSSAAAASNKHHLRELGITNVITVAHDIPPPHPDKFGYIVIFVEDVRAASLIPHFDDLNKFIDEVIDRKESVLIHCMAGVSRSATVTCSYLMYKNKWRVKKAFSEMHKGRNIVSPNETFKKELQYYEKVIHGEASLLPEMKVKNLYELTNIKTSFLKDLCVIDTKKFHETRIERKSAIQQTSTPTQEKTRFRTSIFGSRSEECPEIKF